MPVASVWRIAPGPGIQLHEHAVVAIGRVLPGRNHEGENASVAPHRDVAIALVGRRRGEQTVVAGDIGFLSAGERIDGKQVALVARLTDEHHDVGKLELVGVQVQLQGEKAR